MTIATVMKILSLFEEEIDSAKFRVSFAEERDDKTEKAKHEEALAELVKSYEDFKRAVEGISIRLEV